MTMERTRKSVPTKGVSEWWRVGWSYIMPDFDNKDHSIIEWYSDKEPVYPCVPETQKENANGRARA